MTAAATHGDVLVEGAPLESLEAVAAKMRSVGVTVVREGVFVNSLPAGSLTGKRGDDPIELPIVVTRATR